MKKILVIVYSMILVLLFSAASMAHIHLTPTPGASIQFYGAVPLQVFWVSKDNPAADNDTDLYFNLANNARVGSIVTLGDIKAHWEIGVSGFSNPAGDVSGVKGVYTRLLYGTLKINENTSLLVGQAYSPAYWWANSAFFADWGAIGYGAFYDQRLPRIRVNHIGFFVDFAKPSVAHAFTGVTDTESVLPKTTIGYNHSDKNMKLGAGVAINTFGVKSPTLDENVTSTIGYLHGDVVIMDKVSIRFSGWYGTNPAEFGMAGLPETVNRILGTGGTTTSINAVESSGSIDDTSTCAGYVQLTAKVGKAAAHLGYSRSTSDNDNWAERDSQQEYWVNADIPVYTHEFANMTVTPEIHVYDRMDDNTGADQGSAAVYGAKLQVNF